jgi:3-phosphoshikimate 1-carboxyvinyltransferase
MSGSRAADIHPGPPLRGEVAVPGDKSVSHRAVLFPLLAAGEGRVRGLLRADDVHASLRAARALGLAVEELPGGGLHVRGSAARLQEPSAPLDCANAGTTMRLLLGVLAGLDGHAVLIGDESLSRRPMGRVARPLRSLGMHIDGRAGGDRAPLSVRGVPGGLRGGDVTLEVASAQVKTALLLAGLHAAGPLTVRGEGGRDHSERLLRAMGADLRATPGALTVHPGAPLSVVDVDVPGDISSAAFFFVAAAVVPGAEVWVRGVGLNPTRTGVLDVLARMGAEVTVEPLPDSGGEPRGDVRVRGRGLRGVTVGGAEIPRLIDEIPVLAVAAAFAEGESRFTDAEELRVKESDRVASTVAAIRGLGGDADALPDGILVHGRGALPGGEVDAAGDHRIAMAAAVGARAARGPSRIWGAEAVAVSWPGFWGALEAAGPRR